jgi:hypothetical protein
LARGRVKSESPPVQNQLPNIYLELQARIQKATSEAPRTGT